MIWPVSPAWADAPFGPKVGTRAPPVDRLADQTGRKRRLLDMAGDKGLVLMFFRSAAWCPYCQAQLIAMNEGLGEIEQRGYRLVGISYDKPSVNAEFTARRHIGFALLSDPGSKTIDGWGLRDSEYPPGNLAYGVPRPIIFVLDRSGRIRASLAEETYRKRPPVSEVLKALDGLG
jgi:peroxiredoxin